MRKVILSLTVVASVFLSGCSSEDDVAAEGCKTCDDFASSGAQLEVCDNGDDTVTVAITLSGINVYNEVVPLDSDANFEELDCEYFDGLVDYEF